MITRHQLRIKTLQSLFTFYNQPELTLSIGEKNFIKNIEDIYILYLYLLSLHVEIRKWSENKLEEYKHKNLPSYEDLNPNKKFVDNLFLLQLEKNIDYRKKIEQNSVSWADDQPLIRKLFQIISEEQDFKNYMSDENNNYKSDKEIVRACLLKVISESELVRSTLAEKNITWEDDFDIAIMMVDSTIKQISHNKTENFPLPSLFKDNAVNNKSEDYDFILQLYRKTILHDTEIEKLIKDNLINWDIERISLIDMIILKMSISEILYCPEIPFKVTLNEAIEITKEYSNAKSKLFINGILDRIVLELKNKNLFNKTGRGLID